MANIYSWAAILLRTQTSKHPCRPNVPLLGTPKTDCGGLSRGRAYLLTKAAFPFITIWFVSAKLCLLLFLPWAWDGVPPYLKGARGNTVRFLTHECWRTRKEVGEGERVDFNAKKNSWFLDSLIPQEWPQIHGNPLVSVSWCWDYRYESSCPT